MSETDYYQRNREVTLNRATEYYQNNKEVLREKARNKYRELLDGKKILKENMEEIGTIICLKKISKS